MMLLKVGLCEFSYSKKEVVYIHHTEDGSACNDIWSVELKARETDSNAF